MGKTPPFPDIKGFEYLLRFLSEMGWYEMGISGAIPLSYTEIYSYMQSTNTPLSPKEVKLIRKMSEEYITFAMDKNPAATAPYSTQN